MHFKISHTDISGQIERYKLPTLIKSKTIKDLKELVMRGIIDANDTDALEEVAAKYSIAIPQNIAEMLSVDAIARQFIPSKDELITHERELSDPIGDDAHSPLKGLVHRYKNRVLIKLVEVCGVYCRFCFRRENVGDNKGQALKTDELEQIYEYLRNHKEVEEVILTGGDPLVVSTRRLKEVAENIAKISHIRFFRIHTRTVIANPEVINDELIAALKASQKSVKMVIHTNHATEIDDAVKQALNKLISNQIQLFSQSVLLRGVNDKPEVLADLFNTLLLNNINPYYLHHPDLAKGTGHFYLNLEDGAKIYNETAKLISGLALPKYVIDIPGGFGKIPVNSGQVVKTDGGFILIDNNGRRHNYPIL